MWLAGYYLATLLFIPSAMLMLNYRKLPWIAGITGTWLLISYGVFEKLLYVALPSGVLASWIGS